MTFNLSSIATVCSIILLFASCSREDQQEERLARKYCASCHAFPEPELLDKATWDQRIMPEMAFRMGFNNSALALKIKDEDRAIALFTLPQEPLLTEDEFEKIKNYYNKKAPEFLTPNSEIRTDSVKQFSISKFALPFNTTPLTTLVKIDPVNSKIYLGSQSTLYQFDNNLSLEDSIKLESPLSELTILTKGKLISLLGSEIPGDQSNGKIIAVNGSEETVLDSLQYPVDFQLVDLNGDHLDDYVVCARGNYTGALLAFENVGNGKYKRHILIETPGARKVELRDLDQNGIQDIIVLMAEGDERIMMLSNLGNFQFRTVTLLRFPAVFGCANFELVDFNKDEKYDVILANGDNGDYSPILKPYHGIRIYLNDGTNQFKESWFHPMHGASQVRARDYDQDGDLDIAAISFFPDFTHHPEQGFIYFENTGNEFNAQTTPLASSGRWITMDAEDADGDGDCDLILGSHQSSIGVPTFLQEKWRDENATLLVLRNILH